jgi:hypothetical protein
VEAGGIMRTIFKTIGFNNLLGLVNDVRHVNLAYLECQLVISSKIAHSLRQRA